MRRLFALTLLAALAPIALLGAYRYVDPPITPLMLMRQAAGHDIDKTWRDLERIAPHLPQAVVAAEDNLFCSHHGFDAAALREQVDAVRRGEPARGASTISQQLVKNLLLWPSRSWVRKGLEAVLTPALELMWPKRRIIEVYLNVVEWGPGIYGAQAAAEHHFGKPAGALTPGEAAKLAVVLPNPLQWSPGRASGHVVNRAEVIERRMRQIEPLLSCIAK
ncbi:MAG: monofunctional biosynthetic peptidoglycan transglycosylase [Gammaproteobacteria bacterium]